MKKQKIKRQKNNGDNAILFKSVLLAQVNVLRCDH